MHLIQQNEGTAAQARVPVALYDSDGLAVTGFSAGAGDIQVSKNGAAFGNAAGTLTELSDGAYYFEAGSAPTHDFSTVGFALLKFEDALIRTAFVWVQVIPYDPYDAVRMGLTALPNANAEAAGGLYTRGSGAGQINQNANGQVDTRVVGFANNAITTAAFNDGAMTAAKFADGFITAAKVATDAIDDDALSADAVTAIVAGVFAHVFEDTETFEEFVRLARAALYGDVTDLDTDNPQFLGEDGVTVRIDSDLSGADRVNTLNPA